MYKQSSGRNNRSKGFKIKHVIQLFVLVAICIWLIYQVKHSHDKKREFDEKNIKTTYLSNGGGDEVLKFGRKDVQAQFEKTIVVRDEKGEEAAEEEATEGGGDQEGNKNEEEEQEEDIKHEEKEDEGRGGGDDEIDDNDQHKFDMELEREENLIDEKEREEDEKEAEGTEDEEGQREGENSSEGEEGQRERENSSSEDEEGQREGVNSSSEDKEGQRERENSSEDEEGQREGDEGQRERENSLLEDEEGQRERENSSEDHEAREEHYKADDASSAVAHETENESSEKLNEHSLTEEESLINVDEANNAVHNSTQGNQTVATAAIKMEDSQLEAGNDRIEMGIENSGVRLTDGNGKEEEERTSSILNHQIESDLKTMNLTQIEQKTQERSSQNIVQESESKANTTTTTIGGEDHSMHSEAEGEAGETNKLGSELESESTTGNEMREDPIDSLDSSAHLESVHDVVGMDLDTLPDSRTGGSSHNEDAAAITE